MKLQTCLLPLYCSIAVYCGFLLVFGSGGMYRARELEAERDKIAGNLENLKILNKKLEREIDSFRSDRDNLLLAARELGYLQEGEREIRLDRPASSPAGRDAGMFIPFAEPSWPFGFAIPVCSFIVFWAVRSLLLLAGPSSRGEAGKRSRKGSGKRIERTA